MIHLHPITTLEHPALQPYLTMRRQEEHRQQRIFVAEGEKVVRLLLASELEVISLLLEEKWLEPLQPLLGVTSVALLAVALLTRWRAIRPARSLQP